MKSARSLVLITIDCLRADHVGFLGYKRPTTPFLDCLADESYIFRNAIAAGAPTYYSLPALLASRYPLALGRDFLGMAPDESTIASVLQESGYAAAAFSAANPYVSARFGYDRGFDHFCDFLGSTEFPPENEARPETGIRSRANRTLSRACRAMGPLGAAYDEMYFQYCQRRGSQNAKSLDSLRKFPAADVIVDHAISWLRANSGQPFFLWLHFMDPHSPYFPKAEALELMGDTELGEREARYLNSYWARGDVSQKRLASKREEIIKLYDAGIRWADEQVRRLTESLVELNLWDEAALAVTADHGEEFLDHGGRFHAPYKLSEELVHVPLLVRVPDSSFQEVESATSLIDLAPTLLDVLNVPVPADFSGRSILRGTKKQQPGATAVISECVYGCTNPFYKQNRNGPRILAVRKGNHKLVIDFSSGSEQLFDLKDDPDERNALPPAAVVSIRIELLKCANRYLVESHKARDFDRRQAAQLYDLRLEWAQSAANAPH